MADPTDEDLKWAEGYFYTAKYAISGSEIDTWKDTLALERARIREEEREQCAGIAEKYRHVSVNSALPIAAAIRTPPPRVGGEQG